MADASLTIREQATALVLATLQAALADVKIERTRRDDVAEGEAPVLVLFDGQHTPRYENQGLADFDMALDVEGTVTAAHDSLLGPTTNALYGRIMAALGTGMNLGDPIEQIREADFSGPRLEPTRQGSKPLATFVLALTVSFTTGDGNPYAIS